MCNFVTMHRMMSMLPPQRDNEWIYWDRDRERERCKNPGGYAIYIPTLNLFLKSNKMHPNSHIFTLLNERIIINLYWPMFTLYKSHIFAQYCDGSIIYDEFMILLMNE